MDSFDVTIVGAGPAGSSCALRLKDSGLKVLLLDKDKFPRDKICGDALSGKVVSVLKYTDVPSMEALHQFTPKTGSWGIRFFAPGGEFLDVPFKSDPGQGKAPGYICKRVDFDDFLLRQVKMTTQTLVKEETKIKTIQKSGDHILIETDQGAFQTKTIVGADGAHSIVKKFLHSGHPSKKHHAAGIRAYFKDVSGFSESGFIELHFLHELVPGYFWIFPLPNGWANVGLGLRSDIVSKRKANLKNLLWEVIEAHPSIKLRFLNASLQGEIRGFGLPLGSTWRTIVGDRCILTGDAAGLIDPFSGEGIGNAMLSGKIAAEQLMECFEKDSFGQHDLYPYVEKIRKKIAQELRLSFQMQKLAAYPWLFDFVVKKANRNPSIQTMMSMMFENIDIRKELRKPAFYWKLVFGG